MSGDVQVRRRRSSATDDSFDSEEELVVRPLVRRSSVKSSAKFTPKPMLADPSEELTWPYTEVDLSESGGPPQDLLSLPSPPEGFVWHCFADGTGYLEPINPGLDEPYRSLVIEHLVMQDDTLLGISLRYRARILDIRRLNYLSSDSILHLKAVKVPVKANTLVQLQRNTRDVKVQKFQNTTGEGYEEASIYLEEQDFDLDKGMQTYGEIISFLPLHFLALAMWRSDEQWDRLRSSASHRRQETLWNDRKASGHSPLLVETNLRRRSTSRRSA